ncbi:MAG: quinol:cytochrome C oxidoreductase [bacterium]
MSHGNGNLLKLEDDRVHLNGLAPRLAGGAAVVGVVGLAASIWLGLAEGDGLRHWGFSYLVSFAFWLSISLGALFFVAIQHLTRASWSVVVRRIAEVMAANLPLLAVLAVPILLLTGKLFPWAGGDAHAGLSDHQDLLDHKAPYLNTTFFTIRWVAYFVIWSGLALYYWRKSLQQDRSGEPRLSITLESRSGPALVLFALTVTFASYDLLMSLDPVWFSTMFGPYYFAGGVVGFYAVLTLITFWLQGRGRLAKVIHIEHLHDYGKLLFAFVFFWAYLAFSQYMLIWYANIPEETGWIIRRQSEGWGWLALVLLFGHFLLPFAGLISRYAKRNRKLLLFWAAWIFVMHWADIYWLAMPEFSPIGVPMHLMDLLCFVGLGGIYVAGLAWLAGGRSLVPTRDPRLADSIAFENA